jgi:hypothetical protein
MLIYVEISGVKIMVRKEAEKILKHKYLTIKIQYMWNVKTKVIPEIRRVTGIISKSFRTYMITTPGNCHIGHFTHTAESADVEVH